MMKMESTVDDLKSNQIVIVVYKIILLLLMSKYKLFVLLFSNFE